MKQSACLLLGLLLLIAPLSVVLAEVRPGATTLSPVVGVYGFEGKQDLETKTVYGIRLGYDIVRYFGVEAVGDWVSTYTDSIHPRENHVDVFRYGLDGLFYLAPDWRLVPYLAVGGGGITIKDPGSPWDKSHAYFNYGLGARVSLWPAVALRADVRHILYSDGQTMNNYEGTLGLAFVFGGQKPAAAAPKSAEGSQALEPPPPKPAPAPVAAPAPPPPPAAPVAAPAPPPPPAAPVGGISANPESVDKGQCSTLTWSFANAATVSIEPGIGSVATSGSIQVCLDETKRYTAVAGGEGGSGTASTTVVVNPPPKISLRIEFATGKSDIPPKYIPDIARVADFLKKYPGTMAVIEGHTDNVGKPGANNKLSLARADSVKKYLMGNFGIEGSRLSTAGYGSSRPIADNSTPDGKRQNRRIEAIFR